MQKTVLLLIIVIAGIGLLDIFRPKLISVLPNQPTASDQPVPQLATPPPSKLLPNDYHVFQTFNNCGPAALSMALSYFGITASQENLGADLRPYQVANGDNDDKSVTLEELAEKSQEYGLIPFHRPNGTTELIKLLITYDLPIITRTWLKPNEDIGHYRIIKGYDDITQRFIQDDSLQGKNLEYTYAQFNELWQKFNYEYLVLVPKNKVVIVEHILGEDLDPQVAWQKAAQRSEQELNTQPNDIHAEFNLSVALFNTGNYQGSVKAFERVENQLPFRTLWYQIEPIEAYVRLGRYDRVLTLSEKILNNHNRAFSELYLLRGEVYQKQGKKELARAEFEKAVFYNQHLQKAQAALEVLN